MTKEETQKQTLCEEYPKCFTDFYLYTQCPKCKHTNNKCPRFLETQEKSKNNE